MKMGKNRTSHYNPLFAIVIIIFVILINIIALFTIKSQWGINLGRVSKKEITSNDDYLTLSEVWKYGREYSPFWTEEKLKNWDNSYIEALSELNNRTKDVSIIDVYNKFLAKLEDGHATIIDTTLNDIGTIPYFFDYIDSNVVLIGVESGVDDVPLGSKLLFINDEPIDEYIEEQSKYVGVKTEGTLQSIVSKNISFNVKGKTIRLKFDTPDNQSIEKKVIFSQRKLEQISTINVKLLSGESLYSDGTFWMKEIEGILYLWIGDFSNSNFVEILDTKIAPYFNKYNSIIIDVRNNKGGNTLNGMNLLWLISSYNNYQGYNGIIQNRNIKELIQSTYEEDFSIEDYFIKVNKIAHNLEVVELKNSNVINKPREKNYFNNNFENIFVLTSYYSYSAVDDFAYYANQNPEITTIGEHTGGATGLIGKFALSNGMTLNLSLINCMDESGYGIQNNGVSPKVKVKQNYDDFIKGIDTQLEKTISIIKGR